MGFLESLKSVSQQRLTTNSLLHLLAEISPRRLYYNYWL